MMYTISWEIDLNADNPLQAAKEALDCIVNGQATFFEVRQCYGENDEPLEEPIVFSVDLLEEDEDAVIQF